MLRRLDEINSYIVGMGSCGSLILKSSQDGDCTLCQQKNASAESGPACLCYDMEQNNGSMNSNGHDTLRAADDLGLLV